MKTRIPAVAGQFYPARKDEIEKLLDTIIDQEKDVINYSLADKRLLGGVVPHAGYVYSGYQAMHFFEIVRKSTARFETIFIIHPNHSGYGPDMALDENEEWETPLGKTLIDHDFVDNMGLEKSAIAHQSEHSGEVMLPMLQYALDYNFKIVPVSISGQNYKNSNILANSIHTANQELNKEILIIASSDFSHFVKPQHGKEMDDKVLEEIYKLDGQEIFTTVRKNGISVCGYGPIITLIEYAKLVSVKPSVKLLKRGHSGEVMPSPEVVDYVSMLVYDNG